MLPARRELPDHCCGGIRLLRSLGRDSSHSSHGEGQSLSRRAEEKNKLLGGLCPGSLKPHGEKFIRCSQCFCKKQNKTEKPQLSHSRQVRCAPQEERSGTCCRALAGEGVELQRAAGLHGMARGSSGIRAVAHTGYQ